MLEEAIDVIRRLWSGDEVSMAGKYFTVENARLYDAPPVEIPVVMSAFGDQAAELAARVADGLWTTGGASETIETWKAAGGVGPVYSQIDVCWADDEDDGARHGGRGLADGRSARAAQPGPADARPLRHGRLDRAA